MTRGKAEQAVVPVAIVSFEARSKSRNTLAAAMNPPERRTMSLCPWPGRRAKASSCCRQRCGSWRSAGPGCWSSLHGGQAGGSAHTAARGFGGISTYAA